MAVGRAPARVTHREKAHALAAARNAWVLKASVDVVTGWKEDATVRKWRPSTTRLVAGTSHECQPPTGLKTVAAVFAINPGRLASNNIL
jgi:hypothetical protein